MSKRLKLFPVILIILGLIGLTYCIFGLSLGWGFYFGLKMFLIIGLAFIVQGLMNTFCVKYRNSLVNKIINTCIILFIMSFLIVQTLIVSGSKVNSNEKVEYIIVLGAGIRGDEPSIELRNRLDMAIETFKENEQGKIVVCGGKGSDQSFSEAYVMEKYLVENGIDKSSILKEDRSTNTYENIENANSIIKSIDNRENIKVGVVTNDFHVYRSKLIAKKLGLESVGIPAKTPLYITPNHYMKEYFSLIFYWVFLS